MGGFNRRTQLIAGEPIEVGARRFLPSVLVHSTEAPSVEAGQMRWVQVRPISVIEEGPEGARWHPIPDVTRDRLSVMVAVAAGVGLVGAALLLLARWNRRSN